MDKNEILARARLLEMLTPLCAARNLEVWGVELLFGGGRHKTVRIYLDAPAGIGIEECADISRLVSLALDVDDFIPGAYTLEVSSPGLERPFFSVEQMEPYLGRDIRVRLAVPLDGRKNFKGRLVHLDAPAFTLEVDAATYTLHWADVAKANLVYDQQASNKTGKH